MFSSLAAHPRRLGLASGAVATGLGIAYLIAAGAPLLYPSVNAGAFGLGAALVLIAGRARLPAGPVLLALAAALMATSLFGITADGATRWIALGPLTLQPSLILLPVMVTAFARQPTRLAAAAIAIAAVAMALQPDRAMAGALAAGLAAVAALRPRRETVLVLIISLMAFAAAFVQPDALPAMPFVERVFYTSFAVHPLAGLAVLASAGVLLLPALLARSTTGAAFGAVWLAILLAAALGNYPTPFAGYGASAILGYLISLTALSAGPPSSPA
ncbi:hypothetical protein ACQKH5_18485 [Hyphomonas sp. NPDC076900]|uniref:hypothetical protein n=1 Tax=unclassified Hyphomonas TaxID=2630699 RepID=UPI003D067ED3